MQNKNDELREVCCGEAVIRYRLLRKKVKNINLRISPDGAVTVSAGPRISQKLIDDFISAKGPWIMKSLEKYTNQRHFYSSPKRFEKGETVSFLGSVYAIEIIKSFKSEVICTEGRIVLTSPDPENTLSLQALWDKWQKEQCRVLFEEISRKIHPLFSPFGIPYPVIKVRKMKARWGSCRPSSREITLNRKLIATPTECIEYVVLHEFAHLIYPNHARPFHELVERLMTDWKARKEKLRQYE